MPYPAIGQRVRIQGIWIGAVNALLHIPIPVEHDCRQPTRRYLKPRPYGESYERSPAAPSLTLAPPTATSGPRPWPRSSTGRGRTPFGAVAPSCSRSRSGRVVRLSTWIECWEKSARSVKPLTWDGTCVTSQWSSEAAMAEAISIPRARCLGRRSANSPDTSRFAAWGDFQVGESACPAINERTCPRVTVSADGHGVASCRVPGWACHVNSPTRPDPTRPDRGRRRRHPGGRPLRQRGRGCPDLEEDLRLVKRICQESHFINQEAFVSHTDAFDPTCMFEGRGRGRVPTDS